MSLEINPIVVADAFRRASPSARTAEAPTEFSWMPGTDGSGTRILALSADGLSMRDVTDEVDVSPTGDDGAFRVTHRATGSTQVLGSRPASINEGE